MKMIDQIPATPSRRAFLKTMLCAGIAPWIVPAHVLGAGGKTPPSNRINLGVLGVGSQGMADMNIFLRYEDVRVTALCDVNQRHLAEARQAIQKAYGAAEVREFADFRELNADPSIDAVLMALPVHWHSIPAIDAILHGKHIYHEKPMAISLEEAQRVRKAVQKKGVVFQFGTQQRSDPGFRRACALARSGSLGGLKEIHVSVPAGYEGPDYPVQPVPDYVDWNRWVGPAPWASFHQDKLLRERHECISNFSLGMISCWGIHHLDIAQWGNNADDSGPTSVEGECVFPQKGGHDTMLHWKVRFEFAKAAPIIFVSDGTPGFNHGVKFVGESAWVHVLRGGFSTGPKDFRDDPQFQEPALPVQLPVSNSHPRNFIDAIKNRTRAISDIGAAVRGDTLCQLAHISARLGKKLAWDSAAESFIDNSANKHLRLRPFRGDWKLPEC